MKRIISLCLAVSIIVGLLSGMPAAASEDTEKLGWHLSQVELNHGTASFTLDDVEFAQDATLYITNQEDEVIVTCPFLITSSRQNFELNFPDGITLPIGQYNVWVEDLNFRSTNVWLVNVAQHDFSVYDMTAYPNCVLGTEWSWLDVPYIYAEVGFKKYSAQRDFDGNFFISYPKQKSGSTVKVYLEDGYGCQNVINLVVEEKRVNLPWKLEVYRNGIFSYEVLKSDERLCVDIGGTVYYSEYGAGADLGTDCLISYSGIPADIKTVTVWVESWVGSTSERQSYTLEDCSFSVYDITMNTYPGKTSGHVKPNNQGQIPNSISITLGGTVYSAPVSSDGNFELTYPVQRGESQLNFLFQDEHGCSVNKTDYVSNTLDLGGFGYVYLTVPNKMLADNVKEGCRLYASIGGKEYKSEVATKENKGNVTVHYPVQGVGTSITAWIQNDTTTEVSKKKSYKVVDKKYSNYFDVGVDGISGVLYLDDAKNDEDFLECNVTSVSVRIAGKEYPCKQMADDYSEEELEGMGIDEYTSLYPFSGTYPKQKIGSKLQLLVKDADGYSFTCDLEVENFEPKLKVNPVYSSDKKISGTTVAGSSVTIKYGKKKYKTKAKKNGKFSVKVKSQKVGTRIKVSVVSPKGYTNYDILKVKLDDGDVSIKGCVYRTSSSITLMLYKPKKGDRLILNAGGRQYTKKLAANKKKQKIVIKLKRKPVAGSNVSVVLKDQFGKKKGSHKVRVYYGNTIMKGMSAKNATLTTWGYPLRRNDYGTGSVQWVFRSGDTYLYVYIRGGKVVAIQRINY